LTRPTHIFYGIAPRTDGVLAQLVEHHNGIVGVKGSNPLGSTILKVPVIFSGVMTTIIRLVFLAGLLLAAGRVFPQSPASGPLRLHPGNPRYFADGTGKAVYLSGSHTWSNLPDIGTNRPPAAFDFDAYLRFLTAHHHNFIRLWRWELTAWETSLDGRPVSHHVAPHPWKRSGPGNALDDEPRFNLEVFDEDYFARLRSRVMAAGDNGIYVAVMLFEGWGLQHITNAWRAHPFHRENNVNRVDGDINGDGVGIETHTLQSSAIRELQERYVLKVVDTLQDCDNVLYEIANESGSYSTQWQYHFTRFIKDYEKHKSRQHPVGMTFQQSGNPRQRGMNQALYESPADWISPNPDAGKFNYQTNPPFDIEGRVVLSDTDHLWGIGGDVVWVWKSFCRGLNPIFMDPYDHSVLGSGGTNRWTDVRHAMGQSRRLAERLDLGGMVPRPELATSRYCLAEPRKAYVIYLPEGDTVSLDLRTDSTTYRVEWIQPVEGSAIVGATVSGGAMREFKKPNGAGAVLFLQASSDRAAIPQAVLSLSSATAYFPPPESQGGWRKLEKPEDIRALAGMNPEKLAELQAWLMASDKRNFAAVVIRNGYVVLEVERGNSSRTDSRRVASVSKAVCATVLAIASEQSQRGLGKRRMTFDDPAFDFIPWAQPLSDPRKARITIRQILNHTSGLCPEASGAPNDGGWEYILGHTGDPRTTKLAFDPGTACAYSSHALHHASLICENVTGKSYDQFAIESLFKPLGIEHWWFQFYNGGTNYGKHPSHGLGMPVRDLARIAYCMVRDGRWNDSQVIPRWFVAETAKATHDVKSPELRFKLPAETFSHGWELAAHRGAKSAGIPADARFKPGSGGQLIAFVPSLDLVVTRQTGSSGDWEYEEYLRRACAAALP